MMIRKISLEDLEVLEESGQNGAIGFICGASCLGSFCGMTCSGFFCEGRTCN